MAVAYLLAALVVLAVPPKAGARAEGTAAWWIAGSALFVTYVLLSLLLRVRLSCLIGLVAMACYLSPPSMPGLLLSMGYAELTDMSCASRNVWHMSPFLTSLPMQCFQCAGTRLQRYAPGSRAGLQRRVLAGQQSAETAAYVRSSSLFLE